MNAKVARLHTLPDSSEFEGRHDAPASKTNPILPQEITGKVDSSKFT